MLLSAADIVMEEIGSLFDLLMVIDCCAGGVIKSFFVLFISRTTILLPERNIGQFYRATNCEVRVLELILYGLLEARIFSHIVPWHVDIVCDQ